MNEVPAIEIRELTKFYRSFRALNRVSFRVNEGDFFGFLGPNGAGKTTTISSITGLANFDAGTVRVFGYDVVKDYRRTRALIGLVPQEFNFDPFLTARQILIYEAGYFGVPKREARKRADELLERFQLTPYQQLDFRKLSGGLKRRLLIARALIHRPKILIVDEPTAGLDLELRYKLWDFFKKANSEGITIFLTTHYIEEAEKLCSRIGVIHQGSMVEVDDKQKLIDRMSEDMIEIKLDRYMETVPENWSEFGLELANGGNVIRLHQKGRPLSKLLRAIDAYGVEVLGIHMQKTTLEEIFFRLTRNSDSSDFRRPHRKEG